MLLLGVCSLTLVFALYTCDHLLNTSGFSNPLTHYLQFNYEAVSNSIGVLSSIIAAVLGIIVTVVSIVVQLAANRYTPWVTEMFFKDRTNRLVLSLYIVGCVIGFWTAFAVNTDWVPTVSLLTMLTVATFGFLIMAPYFSYVFRFLSPANIVDSIRAEGEKAIGQAVGGTREKENTADLLRSSDQLADIATNALSQKDRIIAISAVNAIRDLTTYYLSKKQSLPRSWFGLSTSITANADFSSLAEDSLEQVEKDGLWFEFKQLRQFQSIYTEALGVGRDINYAVAINTKQIAQYALNNQHPSSLALAIKFFNTYLRATINSRDVRTAYTILNQYRMIAETALAKGEDAAALQIAEHLRYYGRLSYRQELEFITETVAYDIGALCEFAHRNSSSAENSLRKIFLEVDPASSGSKVQEASLRGVRKAQIKLATYYLAESEKENAREIWEDMKEEPATRLSSIRQELQSVESREFWEISDRGGNFDFLDAGRKEQLDAFFSMAKANETRAP